MTTQEVAQVRMEQLKDQQQEVDKQVRAFLVDAFRDCGNVNAVRILQMFQSERGTTFKRIFESLLANNNQARANFQECWDQIWQKWWYIREYEPDVSVEDLAPFNEAMWKWAKLTAESIKNL